MNKKISLLFSFCLFSCLQTTAMFTPTILLQSKSRMNQILRCAVMNHASANEVAKLLAKGANPNSFKGKHGILSLALYRIDCAVVGTGDQKRIDESVQILRELLKAGMDTTPTDGYDCIEHVFMLAASSSYYNVLDHAHCFLVCNTYYDVLKLLRKK
ncbi:MAG TPA: hypothetical protein VLG50_02440 [Candidatus Saccharimonadales bacterium]|nr:hypothetical protein [Candidatus Saccharimonadales bacterium]